MKWSKAQIRDARKFPLAPLLRDDGLVLHELPGQNFRVERFGDLVVKDGYWIWKSCGLQGNTIDFFVLVQELSFAEAMRKIFPATPPPKPEIEGVGTPQDPARGGTPSEN